jgi:hypothetical protein
MATPTWVWAKSAGSAQNDYAGLDYGSSTIATDQFGNSYITGLFTGPATFGSITLTSTSYPKVFVAKYDTNGTCLWARQFGGNDLDIYGNKGEAIDIDAAGNCYVTGTFHGSAGSKILIGKNVQFGSVQLIQLIGTGHRQIFIVKYSPTGTPLWATQPTGASATNHYAKSIATDFAGNSHITGYLGSTGVIFGGTTLSGPGAFVAKYDTNGLDIWAVKIGDTGNADGASIDVECCGNFSYVTGYFQNSETFGSSILTSLGGRDVFVAAVDSTGTLLWVKQFGFAGNTAYGRGISIDMYGNIFVTGDFDKKIVFGSTALTVGGLGNGEAFISKLDPSGNVLWAKQSTNSQRTQGNAIKASPTGECYVAGHYQGQASVNFMSIPLLSNGSRSTFVVKFDVSGNVVWGQRSGNTNTGESPMGISYDAFLNIYIAGNVQGAAKFGSNTLVAFGGIDAFIAKLS